MPQLAKDSRRVANAKAGLFKDIVQVSGYHYSLQAGGPLRVRLKVSATAIWSAAASEARRRFGLSLCRIHLKTSLSSQSGVALRLPPHSIKSRSVTDSFNHTRPLLKPPRHGRGRGIVIFLLSFS